MTEVIWVLMIWLQIKAGTGYGYSAEVVGRYHTEGACSKVANDIMDYAMDDKASNAAVLAVCIPSEG